MKAVIVLILSLTFLLAGDRMFIKYALRYP